MEKRKEHRKERASRSRREKEERKKEERAREPVSQTQVSSADKTYEKFSKKIQKKNLALNDRFIELEKAVIL